MIPEDAVEAAFQAVWGPNHSDPSNLADAHLLKQLNTALEAAAPHMQAQALEDAADKFGDAEPWSDGNPSPEQIQRWLRAWAAEERGSSGNVWVSK